MSIKVSLSGFGEAWCSLALAVKSRPGPRPFQDRAGQPRGFQPAQEGVAEVTEPENLISDGSSASSKKHAQVPRPSSRSEKRKGNSCKPPFIAHSSSAIPIYAF